MERLRLNVGGRLIETTRATLCARPLSRLAELFRDNVSAMGVCERAEMSVQAGVYFLDRDGKVFAQMLNVLRNVGGDGDGVIDTGPRSPEMRAEIDFWGLNNRASRAPAFVHPAAAAAAAAAAIDPDIVIASGGSSGGGNSSGTRQFENVLIYTLPECSVCRSEDVPAVRAGCPRGVPLGGGGGGVRDNTHDICCACMLRYVRSEITPRAYVIRCAVCVASGDGVFAPLASRDTIAALAAWAEHGARQRSLGGNATLHARRRLRRGHISYCCTVCGDVNGYERTHYEFITRCRPRPRPRHALTSTTMR